LTSSKILNVVLLFFVGPLGLSMRNFSKNAINETFYTINSPQNAEILSYFLEFLVFSLSF